MSLRMIAAVYLAMSRPVWKRFCRRMRATDSGLMPSHVPFLPFDELLHLGNMALIFVALLDLALIIHRARLVWPSMLTALLISFSNHGIHRN